MFDRGPQAQALRDLRTARRRRYADQVDWMESFYRVYLCAIFGGFGFAFIAGVLEDPTVTNQTVEDLARQGPALLGLVVALALAAGLRSGGRGGPLAIEAPDVQHVLLAPIDRGLVLRGMARRRLRTSVFAGAVVGLIVGNFAFRRLPGPPAEWLAFASLFGAAVPLLALTSAMVASGRRLRPAVVNLVAVLILGWSVADFLLGTKTSPATMLGHLGLWPLHDANDSFAMPALGLAAALASVVLGLRWISGTSLEASQRRAALAAQLRAAITFQDLRAVILLRRQLASETPRLRPWIGLPFSTRRRTAVWHRDWRSFLRWPAVRVGRVCVLGVVVGLAICGAWQGTTPLVALAGLALLVAAFDGVEPLAQEIDRPTRRDLLPINAPALIRQHLLAPTAVMIGVELVAIATTLLVGADPGLVLGVAAVMVLPTAFLVLCSAALSTTNDPYAYVLVPELGYIQTAMPVVIAVAGTSLPLLLAKEAANGGHSAAGAAALAEQLVVAACVLVTLGLGQRVAKRVPVKP